MTIYYSNAFNAFGSQAPSRPTREAQVLPQTLAAGKEDRKGEEREEKREKREGKRKGGEKGREKEKEGREGEV